MSFLKIQSLTTLKHQQNREEIEMLKANNYISISAPTRLALKECIAQLRKNNVQLCMMIWARFLLPTHKTHVDVTCVESNEAKGELGMNSTSAKDYIARSNHHLTQSVACSTLQRVILLLLLWTGTALCIRDNGHVDSLPSLASTANIPASEMNALYDLYNATNGEYWRWDTDPAVGIPWNFTDTNKNNPCTDHWQGINCSFTSQFGYFHVDYMYLPLFNLQGSIPATLGNLTQLQVLDLDTNQLTGTIPSSLGNLIHLQYFDLDTNQLTGPIPESLHFLIELHEIYLFSNKLSGTIPESLGWMTQLQYLFLHENQLTGAIPESLGNLTQLKILDLDANQLNGTIPASLGDLSQLQSLYMYKNQLNGTVPNSLGNLILLRDFYLQENQLTGTVPESLRKLIQLRYFDLKNNQLTGTLPASISNLVQLRYLGLDINNLSGTIPESLGTLTQLLSLYLDTNQLSGPIPSPLGNLVQLQYLDLDTNQLTGTIPILFCSLTNVKNFILNDNKLTGPIPDALGNLIQLYGLDLNANRLTGTIPQSLETLVQLQYFGIGTNQLTGTIPEFLGNLSLLQNLFLHTNLLTGTIPESIAHLTHLQYLLLNNNLLTGSIPYLSPSGLVNIEMGHNLLSGSISPMVHLFSLQVLLLQANRLTGTLDNVFDPTTQLQLVTVVVNSNQLTGTLPIAMFQLKLQTFVGTSNCFDGPLPTSAICHNTEMVSFVADGISSASSCQNKLFIGPLTAYSLQHDLGGSIPDCLFQLPNITTLHLSGNGFSGSIPGDIVLSTTLTDLSLSHNALTGSIPPQIQLKEWRKIDLSYNRLSNTLSANFACNGTVGMENNRLSGSIPASFRTMQNISILGSNTFSCSYDESNVPKHDPNRREYHCGSNAFDILYYLWLGIVTCAVIILVYCERKHNFVRQILKDENTIRSTNLYVTLSVVVWLSIRSALYSILVLLPLYCICDLFYGTQTYKYAYQVSAVFMSGVVPFALCWCFWLMLVLAVVVMVRPSPAPASSFRCIQQPKLDLFFSWSTFIFIFTPYLAVDLMVVVGVNALYVYVAVYKSSSLLLMMQILLSIFKICWSKWALPYLLAVLTIGREYGEVSFAAQIAVNMLNNIVIPCLVVAVVSPNCFYNALVAAPAVSSTVSYSNCIAFILPSNACLAYTSTPLPTSYDPPFSYNYQCSSSLITYYSPAFVSMCIISTLVTPMAQYTCRVLHRRATVGTYWHRVWSATVPRTINNGRSYLNICGLITTLICTLGVMLTFGVMFPPLCVALAMSVLAAVFVFKADVSRSLHCTAEQEKNSMVAFLQVEFNSFDAVQMLRDSVWVLVTVSCWFYTLFLFDTLGDAVGFERAYWVLIVMPLMPLIVYIVYSVVYVFIEEQNGVDATIVRDIQVEMKVTTGAGAGAGAGDESTEVHNVLVVGIENQPIEERMSVV